MSLSKATPLTEKARSHTSLWRRATASAHVDSEECDDSDITDSAPDTQNSTLERDDVDNFDDINMWLGDNELHELDGVQNVDDVDI